VPRYVAIDFETADYRRESACAVGLAVVENGAIQVRERYLIRPPDYEPDTAPDRFRFTYIHGLRWHDVKDAPDFAEVWAALQPHLDGAAFFAAHNAGFDRGVLQACCARYDLAPPARDFVCTVQLARHVLGLRPANLPSVARALDIPLDHHDPLSDAEACARIVLAAQDAGWRH